MPSVPLTPLSFLARASRVFRELPAVKEGDRAFSYAEFADRSARLASVLVALGVGAGDRVAVMAPNCSLLLEAHYGVPSVGAALVAVNARLSPVEIAKILGHADVKLFICHDSLRDVGQAAVECLGVTHSFLNQRMLVLGVDAYEQLLATASARDVIESCDEESVISINYTSGTTGQPKGVMYHHRGAYLQALAMAAEFSLSPSSVYLWTLPMYHCNGWCFTWAVTAAGATHVCIPRPDASAVWRAIREEGVTDMCAAPTVISSLVNHHEASPLRDGSLTIGVGGAPPSPSLLEKCARLGLRVNHLYGLTETFGPAIVCQSLPSWSSLSPTDVARARARQGISNLLASEVRVVDDAGCEVPADGRTMGEVIIRGNNVMTGYFRDEAGTAAVLADGWLRTGDLAVLHPDGYLELRDRRKDIIISGGENIASIEVEAALASHEAVLECAVVAAPDEKWGERPVAWVTLRTGHEAGEGELKAHVRERLSAFKVPDRVMFDELPKTSTGKIRKDLLRDRIQPELQVDVGSGE